MKIVTHIKILNHFTQKEEYAVENFSTKKDFLKGCSEIFDAQKNNSELTITLRIIRIDK
ncbi:hypothetical protein [Caudoviricetes sp.]|nr:hypothetical protein [Caudoviricetes sp.]